MNLDGRIGIFLSQKDILTTFLRSIEISRSMTSLRACVLLEFPRLSHNLVRNRLKIGIFVSIDWQTDYALLFGNILLECNTSL